MKKSILSTILLSGLVLSVVAPTALAADVVDNVDTDVEVFLEKEDDGHNEGNGDYFGKLAIVWKPNRFEYAGKTSPEAIFMHNKADYRHRNFIAVNDDRRDEADQGNPKETDPAAKGTWVLKGKLNELSHTSSNQQLEAVMNVRTGKKYIYDIGESYTDPVDNKVKYKPEPIKDISLENELTPALDSLYTVKPDFKLVSKGDAVEVMRKKELNELDKGERGIFTNLGDNDITILKGYGKDAGMYKGTITWTLEDSL